MAEDRKFDKDNFASTKLRWGFFKIDHPTAPDPMFEVVSSAKLKDLGLADIPESFGGNLEYVLCSIFDEDGSLIARDYKEIPATQMRWTGSGTSRKQEEVPFARNPDSWRNLCGKALGRTLSRAGYVDSLRDLKPLLLWRKRDIELRAMVAGIPVPELEAGKVEEIEQALAEAGTSEHPDEVDEVDGDDDVVDGELVGDETDGAQLPLDDQPSGPQVRLPEAESVEEALAQMSRPEVVNELNRLGQSTTGNEATQRARLRQLCAPFTKEAEAS